LYAYSTYSVSPFSQLFVIGHPCSNPPLVSIFYILYAYTNCPHIILNRIYSTYIYIINYIKLVGIKCIHCIFIYRMLKCLIVIRVLKMCLFNLSSFELLNYTHSCAFRIIGFWAKISLKFLFVFNKNKIHFFYYNNVNCINIPLKKSFTVKNFFKSFSGKNVVDTDVFIEFAQK
jgi:hypothetical protein